MPKNIDTNRVFTKDIKELIFHIPTATFWGKMKSFLFDVIIIFLDVANSSSKLILGT